MSMMDPENEEAISTGDQMEGGGQSQQQGQAQQAPAQNPSPAPAGPQGGPGQGPNPKMIASMLLGQGAGQPQMIDQAGKMVDPHGQLGDDDRNLLALHQVAQTKGPQAAWQLMQTHRMAYNAKTSLGYAALQAGNINAATDAANQASAHVLDGSNVKFHAVGGGRRR